MIRNNVISLIVHGILIYALVFLQRDELSLTLPFSTTVVVCVLLSLLYIAIGYSLMKDNGSFLKNMLSTASIIVIGFVIWISCFIRLDYIHLYRNFGDDGFVSEWWMWHDSVWAYFDAYMLPSYTVTFVLEIIFLFLHLNMFPMIVIDTARAIYILIPSMFFCAGIYLKRVRQQKHILNK